MNDLLDYIKQIRDELLELAFENNDNDALHTDHKLTNWLAAHGVDSIDTI